MVWVLLSEAVSQFSGTWHLSSTCRESRSMASGCRVEIEVGRKGCVRPTWFQFAIFAAIVVQGPTLRVPCMGAVHAAAVLAAQAPERKTPAGEWCQRQEPQMSRRAHACECHTHDCSDPDPAHVSAHTDAQCLNYCTVSQCRCGVQDCP